MNLRLSTVRSLNRACTWVDAVAYRPAVVKLTRPLPRWWRCDLAGLSMRLDDRWGTGFWNDETGPAAPSGLCEACGRRAAFFTVGGYYDDEPELFENEPHHQFMGHPTVHLCGWCSLISAGPIENETELEQALADAGRRSISWHWSWRVK